MPISGDQQDLGDVAWWSTAIVGSAADAILSFGVDGVITSWNPAAERLYGYRAGEAVGRHISMVFPPSLPAKPHDILVAVRAGSYVGNFETQVTHKEGFDVAVAVTLRPLFDPDGRLIGASAVSHQLWDATPAARAREEAEGHFQAAFRRSDFGIVLSAIGGEATAVNPATCDLLGRPAEELIGNNWSRFTHPEDLHVAELAMAGFSEGRDSVSFECRFALPDGRFVWLMINTTLVRDRADRPSFLMTQLHDITDRKKAESELEYRALHDHLTGLPGRTLLSDRLDHALAVSGRTGSKVCVMFLDLNGFKDINDSYGHAIGDRVLVEVARRLAASIRPGDTAARIGGDEYVVVCQGLDSDASLSVASRIAEALQQPVRVDHLDLSIAVSVGLALSDPSSTAESLLVRADADMYAAKREGANRTPGPDLSLRTVRTGALRVEPVADPAP